MDKSVYIIILNYKNLDDTFNCLDSLRKISYKNYHMIVVDNDSQDGSYEYLKERATDYKVIPSGENGGYAAGNNIGIRYALSQGADYVCILNNDVEAEPDFLNVLVEYMEDNPKVGMSGPLVYEFADRNKIQSAGFSITVRTGSTKPLLQGKNKNDTDIHAAIQRGSASFCDALSGTCFLVRREVLERVGLIPECYFLFFEEMEWCLNVRKHGYKLAAVFAAEVYHKGSATLKKTGTVGRYYMARNQVLFVRRNGTTFESCFFLVTEGLGYLFRCIFSSRREVRQMEWRAFREGLMMDKNDRKD